MDSVTNNSTARPDPPENDGSVTNKNESVMTNNEPRLGRTFLDPPTATDQPQVPLIPSEDEEEQKQDGSNTETSLALCPSQPSPDDSCRDMEQKKPAAKASVIETSLVLHDPLQTQPKVGSKRKGDVSELTTDDPFHQTLNKKLGSSLGPLFVSEQNDKPIPVAVNGDNLAAQSFILLTPATANKNAKKRKKLPTIGEDPWKVNMDDLPPVQENAELWHEQSDVRAHEEDASEHIENHQMRMWAVCSEIEYEGLRTTPK